MNVDVERQIRQIVSQEVATASPIDFAEIEQRGVAPHPMHTARRTGWSAWAVVAGGAVATLILIGSVGLVGMSSSNPTATSQPGTPAPDALTDSAQKPSTESSETPPAATLNPATTGDPSAPLGTISWEFVDRPDGTVPPEAWPGRPMASTSSGYHFWISCEQYEPAGSSFIWSSPDGISWNRQTINCDDSAFGVADKLILDPFPGEASFISDDGRNWTHLTSDGPNGDAERGGPLWHGSDNGFSPSALIWEIDDIGIMYDFSMPWDIWGYSPTGWLMEFDNGLTAISICCRTDWLRDPIVKHSSDNHNWIDIPIPPFVEEGWIETPNPWSTVAHQHGIAVVAATSGTDTRLWRTTDGLEWSEVTPSIVPPGGVWAADRFWVQGLGFFAGDDQGRTINLSTDGMTWTATEIPQDVASFKGTVRVANNKIFVFGDQLLIGTYNPVTNAAKNP